MGQLWLGMLGIDGSDASSLYKQLGGHVGGLSCDTFVYGVKRLKGEARSQDLIPLVNDCKQILRLCEQSRDAWSNIDVKLRMQLPQDMLSTEGSQKFSNAASMGRRSLDPAKIDCED